MAVLAQSERLHVLTDTWAGQAETVMSLVHYLLLQSYLHYCKFS